MKTKKEIALEVALKRKEMHVKGGNYVSAAHDQVDVVGMMGEIQFSEEFNMPLDLEDRLHGDKGIDFIKNGITIDVKTFHTLPFLLVQHKYVLQRRYADIFVLARYSGGEKADLLGWISSTGIENWPTKIFEKKRGIVNHFKTVAQLVPMSELRKKLGMAEQYIEGMARVRGEQVSFRFSEEADRCWHCKGKKKCSCAGCTFDAFGSVFFQTNSVTCGSCKGAGLLCW